VTGEIAYPAGSVVVVYNPKRNKQTRFFVSKSNKPIVSLCFSPNGKFLATGEVRLPSFLVVSELIFFFFFFLPFFSQSGHQPSITVWDLTTQQAVADFKGHKFGVSCLAFSPNMKHLASVGFQHDGYLTLWDWKTGSQVGGNKIATKVRA
jgi:WD40 repeat protein